MEIWKEIKGYENLYLISNKGNVKSLYNYRGKNHILKQKLQKNGYFEVGLRKNGIKKYYLVHRLVAEAFIENKQHLPTINHKDENKKNNDVSNLEWCSIKYNNTYGTRIERCKEKLNKPVCKYSLDGELIEIYKSIKEASIKNNIKSSSNIINCINGIYKQAGGFVWERK